MRAEAGEDFSRGLEKLAEGISLLPHGIKSRVRQLGRQNSQALVKAVYP
jgi:hypothetical protein